MWVGWGGGGGGGVGEQQDLPLNMWEIHPINSTQHLQRLLFTSVNNVPQALPADMIGHCAHRVKLCRVRGRRVTLLTLMPDVLHMLQRDELRNQPPPPLPSAHVPSGPRCCLRSCIVSDWIYIYKNCLTRLSTDCCNIYRASCSHPWPAGVTGQII